MHGLRLGVVVGLAWGGLAAAKAVHAYATTSPRFEVRTLVFRETAHVDLERLRALLSIAPGTNTLALDLRQLEARVTGDPWVAEARIERELPDTLRVEITEHVPAAALLAGHFYLVDGEGVPFKRLQAGERGDLPILTGVPRADLVADRRAAAARVREALLVLREYGSKQRPRLSEVHLGDGDELTLYTADSGTQIRLRQEGLAMRLDRWDALRAALGERGDQLAIVHLDGTLGSPRGDRIVARFIDEDVRAAALSEVAPTSTITDEPGPGTREPAIVTPKKRERRKRIPRAQ